MTIKIGISETTDGLASEAVETQSITSVDDLYEEWSIFMADLDILKGLYDWWTLPRLPTFVEPERIGDACVKENSFSVRLTVTTEDWWLIFTVFKPGTQDIHNSVRVIHNDVCCAHRQNVARDDLMDLSRGLRFLMKEGSQ